VCETPAARAISLIVTGIGGDSPDCTRVLKYIVGKNECQINREKLRFGLSAVLPNKYNRNQLWIRIHDLSIHNWARSDTMVLLSGQIIV